ncbi:MAG: 5'-nucleotidase, lipoprotein e(P4) family [Mucilaginibacter sp.]
MKKALIFILLCGFGTTVFAQNGQDTPISAVNSGKIWGTVYQQRAAEYKALCFQAYNIAKLRLDMALKRHHRKPLAVVTDIDETLLDNSPNTAGRAIQNKDFDQQAWHTWTARAICDTVPGAPAFFKYAASKGVAVYYITNRLENEREGTIKNLKLYHLPFADNKHLILKSTSSSKEARRRDVLKTHEVALYCGDNLPDFNALYDSPYTEQSRNAATEKLKKEFGHKYIVIPNIGYGDWENALLKGALTNAQKDSLIKTVVKTDLK